MAKKKPQEDIVLYASIETEGSVEVELAVCAPTRSGAQKVITDITRALTGDEPLELSSAGSVVLTDEPGFPNGGSPASVNRPGPEEEEAAD